MTPFNYCKDCAITSFKANDEEGYGNNDMCAKCHQFALQMALDLLSETHSDYELTKIHNYIKEHTGINFKKEFKKSVK